MSLGEELRDEGIDRVLAGTSDGWKAQYTAICGAWFAALPTGAVFTGEMMRFNAQDRGLPEPHHPNVWGGVAHGYLRALLSLDLIERLDMVKATSAKSHAHHYRTYRKL